MIPTSRPLPRHDTTPLGFSNAAGSLPYQTYNGVPYGTWESAIFDYAHLKRSFVGLNGFTRSLTPPSPSLSLSSSPSHILSHTKYPLSSMCRYWDSGAKVPYLYNPTSRVWISYDDDESMRSKATYVNTRGLGGVMAWEVSSDNGDLLGALHGTLAC